DVAPLSTQAPVSTLLNSATTRLSHLGIDPMQADIEAHYHWIDNVVAGALIPACAALDDLPPAPQLSLPAPTRPLEYAQPKTLTQKVDEVLVHKVWGLVIFAAVMALLFVSIF